MAENILYYPFQREETCKSQNLPGYLPTRYVYQIHRLQDQSLTPIQETNNPLEVSKSLPYRTTVALSTITAYSTLTLQQYSLICVSLNKYNSLCLCPNYSLPLNHPLLFPHLANSCPLPKFLTLWSRPR